MKIQSEFLQRAIVIVCAALLITSENSIAQENGPKILIAQRQNQKSQVSFVVNQTVGYLTVGTKTFTRGRITEITDSTVSFELKDHEFKKVRCKDLTAFRLTKSMEVIDFSIPKTNYNLKQVSITLKNDKKISGPLISLTHDSLVIQIRRRKRITIGYAEIKSVGIHKKGSGGFGALLGGIAGGGIGAIIGAANRPSNDPSGVGSLSVPAGAILGFLIGIPIGSAVGSTNKQHAIDGDKEKFHSLSEKLNKKLWTLVVSKVPGKN